MISMSGISRPVRVGVVWRNDLQFAARLCYAVQLSNETKHIRHVLNNVTTDNLFKFIVVERIRKVSQIVNYICMTQAIRIDADRAGKLVLTTADVENPFLHRSVFTQQQCR